MRNAKLKILKIFIYSMPFLIISILCLLAYYPAIMTPDSIGQWNQMVSFEFNDWHPVMHTFFNFLITRLWYNPAAIAIVQILIIGITLGYVLYIYEKMQINKRILILISLVFSIFPANSLMSICLWKDIPYSGMIFLFTATIIRIVYFGNKELEKKSVIVTFVVSSLGVLFFRHNGLLVILGTYIIMIIVIKQKRKFFSIILVTLMAILFLVKGPIYNLLNVVPAEKSEALGVCVNSIGNIVKNNGYVTQTQKKELDKILPYDLWVENYNPYSTNNIKFSEKFNEKLVSNDPLNFIDLWFGIAKNNLGLTLEAYFKQMSLVWKVNDSKDDRIPVFIYEYPIYKNNFKIISNTKSEKLLNCFQFIYKKTNDGLVSRLFWRPALEFYLAIIILLITAILTKNKKILLIASPMVFNIMGMLIAMPAQDYRYLYSNVLVFFAILPMMFLIKKKGVLDE